MNLLYWDMYIIFSLLIGLIITTLALYVPKQQKAVFSFPDSSNILLLYLLGELLTLLSFILIKIKFDHLDELIIAYPFIMLMIAATLSDIKYQIIPNKFTYFGAILFFILRLIIHPLPVWNYLIGSVIGSGFLLLTAVVSKGGIGGGDIKLFLPIGLVLGWQNTLIALFLSTSLSALIGGILILFKIVHRKQLIPFGPFIFAGTIIVYFFQNEIFKVLPIGKFSLVLLN